MSKPIPNTAPVHRAFRPCLLALAWLLVATAAGAQGTTRTYYLAAEEVMWDYAPGRAGPPVQAAGSDTDPAVTTDAPRRERRGRRYRKIVYREYSDAGFELYRARPEEHEHLGILGPLLRATVGDTMRVVFMNKTRDHTLSLHAAGLRYGKDSEGAGYADGTRGGDKLDERVPPGARHTYVWQVPPEAGPGPADPSSVLRLYHSRVHARADIQAGLLGPIIISRPFQSHEDAMPADIDREFVTLLGVFDEGLSLMEAGNTRTAARQDSAQPGDQIYSINGLVSGHLPELSVQAGDRVRWHVLTLGQGGHMHTPHWHGNNVTAYGSYTDRIGLLPWTARSVTMHAVNPGIWLFHCLVADHTGLGMAATYTVREP